MSILTNKFDIITNDPHSNALASLVVVLDVASAPAPSIYGTPTAGTIAAGTIVVMNTSGLAIPADNGAATTNAPCLMFIAADGDVDLDGAFVHKITCIQGGCEIMTPLYATAGYSPGATLTCGDTADIGKFRAAGTGEQIYGVVGPAGLDTVNLLLNVIIPQGIAPAHA